MLSAPVYSIKCKSVKKLESLDLMYQSYNKIKLYIEKKNGNFKFKNCTITNDINNVTEDIIIDNNGYKIITNKEVLVIVIQIMKKIKFIIF